MTEYSFCDPFNSPDTTIGLVCECVSEGLDSNFWTKRPLTKSFSKLVRLLSLHVSALVHEIRLPLCNVQKWYDYRLQWDESDFEGIKYLYISATKLWLPNVAIINK